MGVDVRGDGMCTRLCVLCGRGCVWGWDVHKGMCFGPKTLHHDSVSPRIQVDGSIPLGR